MKTVVIFGGSGFVGQNIIYRVAKKGYKIIVPFQRPINEAKLRLFGNLGQIIPIKFRNLEENLIQNVIRNSDALINLKTIWYEKKLFTYKNSILNFNFQLVDLINSIDKNKNFIFFSGLGVKKDSSSIRSQYIEKVEKYISQNLINSSIIRPSVIIGGGDKFLGKLLLIFKFSFVIPLFEGGNTKLQPVYVGDIAKAIENIVVNQIKGNHKYELVGPETFTYKSLYQYIANCLNVRRVFVTIPFNLAKIAVFFIEKTPLNFITLDQLMLFKEDNLIENIDKNFKDLGIQPRDTKEVIKKTIKK